MMQWLRERAHVKSVAMLGCSNVGKSTLINALFGKKTARISKTPGRTRVVNVFELRINGVVRYLYDLPGYGYARISKQMRRDWDQLMGVFFGGLQPATLIITIQDARHPHRQADRDFYRYLLSFNLPAILVFNKLDKLKTQKERQVFEKQKAQILCDYKGMKQIFYLSAHTGKGLEALESSLVGFLSV